MKTKKNYKDLILGNNCKYIEECESNTIHRRAKFECFCGNKFEAQISSIVKLKILSCGCINSDTKKQKTYNVFITKMPEYNIYKSMKARCYNLNSKRYKDYGGRGIKVSQEWKSNFLQFVSDMGKRPSKEYTLDRINNNLDYCKENCKWSDKTEQANNKRNTIYLDYLGKKQTLSQWSKEYNISIGLVRSRYYKNLTPENILKIV